MLTEFRLLGERAINAIGNEDEVCLADLLASDLVPQKYPLLFNDKQWGWMVKQRKYNGLEAAFHKIGKRLYVNEKVLAKCINQQAG